MAIEPNEAVKTPDELVDLMRTQNATFLENQRRRHDEAMASMAELKAAVEGRIADLTAEVERLRASEQSAALRGAERMREAAADFIQEHGPSDTIGNWEAAGTIRKLDPAAVIGEGRDG